MTVENVSQLTQRKNGAIQMAEEHILVVVLINIIPILNNGSRKSLSMVIRREHLLPSGIGRRSLNLESMRKRPRI